ncbi:MAG TPA: LysM peptidoglycan-binding domain-containing protein [Candidatus Acidoferrum sp.]|nr:LysM peptidoglycan-binding domain-containing protein [Candidatus Acidoferrum sp.]
MRLNTVIPGPLKKGRGTLLFGLSGFLLAGLVCAGGLHAQDAAGAARQEKARKAAESKSSHHVYTEDDLKRAKILTPEDQAKVAARKNNPTEKKEEQAKGGGESAPGEESLGEVARRYRKEKAEREAARATGQGDRSQFPMKMPEATMAAPKMLVQPRMEERAAGSSGRSAAGRVSPFEPRPLRVAPVMPGAPREPGANLLRVEPEVVARNAAMILRKVERGDSWWKLAEIYLGKGTRWRELRGMNAADARPPELLLLGSTVVVPAEVAGRGTPVAKSVTVQKGDTLWRLARVHLGRGAAWKCLMAANPELGEPERLRIGQKVLLPAEGTGRACVAGVVGKVKN